MSILSMALPKKWKKKNLKNDLNMYQNSITATTTKNLCFASHFTNEKVWSMFSD